MEDQPVRTLRVGVVGAGAWSREAHVPGFRSTPGVRLVAICDTDVSRAQQVADEAGISRAYASAAAMFAEETLDLASIVTPMIVTAPTWSSRSPLVHMSSVRSPWRQPLRTPGCWRPLQNRQTCRPELDLCSAMRLPC